MDLLLQNTQGYINPLVNNNNIKKIYPSAVLCRSIYWFICVCALTCSCVSNFVQWHCDQRTDFKSLFPVPKFPIVFCFQVSFTGASIPIVVLLYQPKALCIPGKCSVIELQLNFLFIKREYLYLLGCFHLCMSFLYSFPCRWLY